MVAQASASAGASASTSSASGTPTEATDTSVGSPEGISAFAARVLDQLSVSAWLPAAVLSTGLFFLLKARSNDGDLMSALADAGDTRGTTIVLLGVAVVLMTTVTQAFEFGSIRMLEGYWGHGRTRSVLAGLFCHNQMRRRRRAVARHKTALIAAFDSARPGLVQAKVSPEVIAYLAADVRDESPLPALTPEQEGEVDENDWRLRASPELIRRLASIDGTLDRLPKPHRTMPTRVGNTLRLYEDQANSLLPGSVRGMVQRVFHRLPPHVQSELDQYRNRLGLYASLVAVSGVLAVAAAGLVATSELLPGLALTAVALVGSGVFYGSAVSSADAYGSLLVEAMGLAASTAPTASGRGSGLQCYVATAFRTRRHAGIPASCVRRIRTRIGGSSVRRRRELADRPRTHLLIARGRTEASLSGAWSRTISMAGARRSELGQTILDSGRHVASTRQLSVVVARRLDADTQSPENKGGRAGDRWRCQSGSAAARRLMW